MEIFSGSHHTEYLSLYNIFLDTASSEFYYVISGSRLYAAWLEGKNTGTCLYYML